MRIPRAARLPIKSEINPFLATEHLDALLHHLDALPVAELARERLGYRLGDGGCIRVEVVGVPAYGVGVAGVGLGVGGEGAAQTGEAEVAEGADVVGDNFDAEGWGGHCW